MPVLLPKLFFNLCIFLVLFPLTSSLSFAETNSSTKRPAPPRRIPPNKVKPGGGLNFSQQSCSNSNESLTALVPINNPVLTAKAHPSFLFYIPDPPAAISYGEFSILTADEKKRIYQTSITFDRTPGIIKINLPPEEQYALKSDRLYHWYFKIYCQNSSNTARFLDVDGWIERVPLTPAIKSQLADSSSSIWYDAIAKEAQEIITNPHTLPRTQSWIELMKHIDGEHLTDIIIIENVTNPAIKNTN